MLCVEPEEIGVHVIRSMVCLDEFTDQSGALLARVFFFLRSWIGESFATYFDGPTLPWTKFSYRTIVHTHPTRPRSVHLECFTISLAGCTVYEPNFTHAELYQESTY